MIKIGFFGGTFDPPHLGHIRAEQAFYNAIRPDKLFVIPTNIPPMKEQKAASPLHRLAMCRLCFMGEAWDIELTAGGVSYTYLTAEKLKTLYPLSELYMLIGSDQLMQLNKWRNAEYLKQNIIFAAAPRYSNSQSDLDAAEKLRGEGYKIITLEMAETEISSTDIRKGMKNGNYTGFLHENVIKYIKEHKLYENL